ncbi:MAG: class I SAM-dependent methyltransferase [Bacteroidota bacterium]
MPASSHQNAQEIFNQAAQRYEEKYMDLSLYQAGLEAFCEQIKNPKAQILDIACGPGNLTQFLLSLRPDFQILGIDLAEKMLSLAKRNNPSATFQLMNATEISSLPTIYEGIICGFGLPYLSKEEAIQLIFDAADLLRLRGTLYLSTMEGNYESSGFVGSSEDKSQQLYTYYHQADYLIEALQKAGFRQIEQQRREYMRTEGQIERDLILIASC